MTGFAFHKLPTPFPRWMGPFSPGRGNHSGFHVRNGMLGTWVQDGGGQRFWWVRGADSLVDCVERHWSGGRVLLLPNGFVVKPLQRDHDVGVRALIGHFTGSLLLKAADGSTFDLRSPGELREGAHWPGPSTTGLECVIRQDGSLSCRWYHPTDWGRDETICLLRGPDCRLAEGFRVARLGENGGRVRITASGHIITNRRENYGGWDARYVGWASPESWKDWEQWIENN